MKNFNQGEIKMLTKIEDYPEHKASLSKLNKAKLKVENMQKLFEASQKVSDDLSLTLGIEKIGEQIDFDQVEKVERKAKIKKREVKIAEKEYLDAQKELENTILVIKELRRAEAREVGKKINKKVLKIMKSIEKLKSDYIILHKDISKDLSKRDRIDKWDVHDIIGPTPAYINFGNKLAYPTAFYLEQSNIFQKKDLKEKYEEIKDI